MPDLERARLSLHTDGMLRLEPPTGRTYREVKEALGATWDDTTGTWKFPALRSNVLQVLEGFGWDAVSLSDDVVRLGDDHGFEVKPVPMPKDLPAPLFEFQRQAVEYAVSAPHGVLLNISPGLGKTVIAITAARCLEAGHSLIVAPASLLRTWAREIAKWAPGATVEIAHGERPTRATAFTVTTYDMLVKHPDWFSVRKFRWDFLIVDESVLVKNRSTRRYQAVANLRGQADRVCLLSGNPITRFADDLWTQMHVAYPRAFPSYWRFSRRFCVFEDNIWAKTGETIVGTRESRDVTWELGDMMLTVNQEDVLPELPEYLYETVDVELGTRQARLYGQMLRDFLIELDTGTLEADNRLAQLIRLQQITSGLANIEGAGGQSAKADALLDLVLAQAYRFPMLVWTHWRGGAEHVTRLLRRAQINAEWVSGSDAPNVRDAKIEAYKAGHTDVLVLSIGVGKFGHTLTNTRTVVYLDKTWAADDYVQSLRRVRRIGLKERPVLVTLRAPSTVDDLVEMNLAGKMPSIAKVTNSQLKELLKGLGL